MRRLLTYTTAMLVALAGTVAVAQKATNPGELEAAMKRVSAANAGVGKGIKSEAYADAKTSVAAVKAALMDAENFWVMNKKDDAVKMSKEAIAKVTALETILSAPTRRSAGRLRGGQGSRWHVRRVPQGVPRPERGQDVLPQAWRHLNLATPNSQPPTPKELPTQNVWELGVGGLGVDQDQFKSSFAFLNTLSIISGVSFPVFVFCRLG